MLHVVFSEGSVLVNSDADFRNAGKHFVTHQMADANLCVLALLQAERQVAVLVLMRVHALAQGLSFGIGQRIANRVAQAYVPFGVSLFHRQHDVLRADVRHGAETYRERPVEVPVGRRDVKADSVAPLPTLHGQGLVAVEHCAIVARRKQQSNQGKE